MNPIAPFNEYNQALAAIKQRLQVSLDRAQSLNLSHILWDKFPGDMCASCLPISAFAALMHAEETKSHDGLQNHRRIEPLHRP